MLLVDIDEPQEDDEEEEEEEDADEEADATAAAEVAAARSFRRTGALMRLVASRLELFELLVDCGVLAADEEADEEEDGAVRVVELSPLTLRIFE